MIEEITEEVNSHLEEYGSVEEAVDSIFPELNNKYDLWVLFSARERIDILKEAVLTSDDMGKTIEKTKQQGIKVLPKAAITKMKQYICQKIKQT